MTASKSSTPAADEAESTDTEALEDERDFLFRSLDDLDNERAAGNIDAATYERLHADYTARAANVLRRLRDGVAVPLPEAPRVSGRRRLLTYGAIGAFAIVAAVLLATSVHQRTPGGTITGNLPNTATTAPSAKALQQAVKDHPNDYNARIALARFDLNNDLKGAVEQYDAASKLEPKQPEPLAYGGWIRAIVARSVSSTTDRNLLVDDAFKHFDQAIKLQPGYPDAYVFRALTNFEVLNRPAAAIPDFKKFLQLAPANHPMRELVSSALAQAQSAVTASTTVPSTTKP